jgi:DsbC/DsbD-like thiol-disulfide interchange protein
MKRFCFSLFAVTALAFAWAAHADAGGAGKSESKVKASATATKAGDDGKQTVTITLEIVKGWHIYANPVRDEGFEVNKTLVSVSAKEKVVASVKYPEGKIRIEDLGKEKVKIRIYDDKVTIQALVTRTMGDTSPLQISIDVNACDDKNCLPKGVLKLTVPSTK